MAPKTSSKSSSTQVPTNVPAGKTVVLSPTTGIKGFAPVPTNVPAGKTVVIKSPVSSKSKTTVPTNVPAGKTVVLKSPTNSPRYTSGGVSSSFSGTPQIAEFATPTTFRSTFSSGASFTPSASAGGGMTSYNGSMASGVNRSNQVVPVANTLSSNQFNIPDSTYENTAVSDIYKATPEPPTPEEEKAKMEQKSKEEEMKSMQTITDNLFGQRPSDILEQAKQEAGVNDYGSILADTQNKITRLKRDVELEKRALDAEPISLGARAGRENEIDRKYAYELADLALAEAAFSNRYEQALKYAELKADIAVKDMEYDQQRYYAQYLANKDNFSPEEKKMAEASLTAMGFKIQETQNDNELLKQQQRALIDQINKGIDVIPGMDKQSQIYAIASATNWAELPAPGSLEGQGEMTPRQTTAYNAITTKFISDAVINKANNAKSTVAIADQVIENPGNATNQLKSLYTLVKALDPDSAVREGEIGLADQTQSYLQRFSNSIGRLAKGRVISPQAATELATATKDLATEWIAAADRKSQAYKAQAIGNGISGQFDQFLSDTGSFANTSSKASKQQLDQGRINFLRQKGYSPEQINAYMNRQSFNTVGNTKVSLGSPLARKNNNPGNIRYGKFAQSLGAVPGANGFAKFPDPETGVNAVSRLLDTSSYRNLTLAQVINRYAPPSENDTSLYVKQMSKMLNVPPNTPIQNIDRNALVAAIIKKESSSSLT